MSSPSSWSCYILKDEVNSRNSLEHLLPPLPFYQLLLQVQIAINIITRILIINITLTLIRVFIINIILTLIGVFVINIILTFNRVFIMNITASQDCQENLSWWE